MSEFVFRPPPRSQPLFLLTEEVFFFFFLSSAVFLALCDPLPPLLPPRPESGLVVVVSDQDDVLEVLQLDVSVLLFEVCCEFRSFQYSWFQ